MKVSKFIYSFIFLFPMLGILLPGCVDKEATIYVSMNRSEKTMYKGENYQFSVNVQSSDNIAYTENITWSVEKNIPRTDLDVPQDAEVISIDNTGTVTALNYGEATIKAVTSSGRFVYAQITVDQRPSPSADGLSFTETDHYMSATISGDSLVFVVDTTRVNYCPVDDLINEIQVTSEDESILKVSLQHATVNVKNEETGVVTKKIVRDRFWVILDVVDQSKDKTIVVTATLGETSLSANVHIGVNLFLSLAPYISDGVGKPTVLEEMSYKIPINNRTLNPNGNPDTIRVYYRATPESRVDDIVKDFKLTTSGESVLFVTGHRLADDYTSSREYWIFVETGPTSGDTEIKLSSELAGVSVTAKCEVFDKYEHPITSLKFKKNEDEWSETVEYTTQQKTNALLELLEANPFGIIDYWPVHWEITSGDAEIQYLYAADETSKKQVLSDVLMNAKSPGKVVVTATIGDDRIGKKTAKATYTVLSRIDNISISLPKTEYALYETGKAAIEAVSNFPVPESAIEWHSLNERVVTINQRGEFSAVGVGTVKIEADVTDDLGHRSTAETTLTVTDNSQIHDLNFNSGTYLYFESTDGYIMAYPTADDRISYRIKVLDLLGKDGTYNITGRDIEYVVYNEKASFISGTLTVKGSKLTFNNVKAQKGSKTVTISGSMNYDN